MGIGMKVDYIGLTQTVPIEAAAGVQLVRLAPFAQHIDGCHRSLAALHNGAAGPIYEARLHVVTCAGERIHMGNCSNCDFVEAMRGAFDLAVDELASWPD